MLGNSGDVKARLRLLLPFIVGYALLDAWSQTVFSTSFFAQTTPSDQVIKSIMPLVPAFVLLLTSRHISQLVRRRYREVMYLFGMAASAGTGLLLFIMYGALDAYWTKFTLSLLVMARACLLICWWERLAVFPIKDMWLALGCAIALGGFLNMAPVFAPEAASNCLVVIAPLASTVLLPVRSGREDEPPSASPAFGAADGGRSLRKMLSSIPWMLVLVLGLMNIPSEALVYLEMIGDTGATVERNPFTSALIRMAVNLTALLLAYMAVRVNIGLAFFVAVPVVIVLAFFLELGIDVSFSAMHSVCRVGSEMVRYSIIYMLLTSALRRHVPPLLCFSFMTLVHSAGSALGVLVAFTLQGDSNVIAMLFMGILLVAMLFVIGDMQRNGPLAAARAAVAAGEEAVGAKAAVPLAQPLDCPAHCPHAEAASNAVAALRGANDTAAVVTSGIEDAPEASSSPALDAAQAFAERYGLTQREREVMELWVRGRTAAYIEEQLCISKYTVKTHVNHIYEKTGVNSKEDLISLTEAFSIGL